VTTGHAEKRTTEEHAWQHARRAWWQYIFSTDHKIIGLQFLLSSLIWFLVGGLLAMAIRWQLAWPWTEMPIVGRWLFAAQGGQISPEYYNTLFTMHGTIMIFFVIIPILTGAFGNYLIPLMIGAPDMAFPRLNMFSYWLMWPGFLFMILSFCTPGYGAGAGWTAYPPLSAVAATMPNAQDAQTYWLLAMLFVGAASMLGALNYITTIALLRAPGMRMGRLPMTVWSLLVTSILQAFALPVLTAGLLMQVADRQWGTGFFLPEASSINNESVYGGGQPLLWQHLFWFYSHPAVYVMILPAMGMISDILSCFARKPLFGYRPMVVAVIAIAGLGFIVWGHHMFVSGMNPLLGMTFMVSTMLIALPSGVKVFNWLATIWGGRLQFTTSMLFGLGFVIMFVIGGLSGILMAATPVDIFIHDTYLIVAHFHYVLFAGSVMAVFAAIHFWYPKMFGRMLSENLGRAHFLLTFLCLNGTFFPMHLLGARGFPRRYADPYHIDAFADLLPLNRFITYCAFALSAAQILFIVNFFGCLIWGRRAETNPWGANSLEWTTDSPPPHGNFIHQPRVYRGPYEYSHPDSKSDFWAQSDSRNTL
jgi:cytochrome c oxidase subunit 1